MIRVNRAQLLQQLESVLPGLAQREIVEQSSCFVFKDGEVITFNDDVACRRGCELKITGAVHAEPLLAVLRKLPEEDVRIEIGDGRLLIKGKSNRESGITMDAEILTPVDKVKPPEKWKKLNEEFADAITIVSQCAGKDEDAFAATCVHITPDWVEAFDNSKMTRYNLRTKIKEPVLVRATSIKSMTALGMTEFSETDTWLHFRNPVGLVMSVRIWREEATDFPDLTPFLKTSGVPTTFPKGLVDAVARCNIFSSEMAENNQVSVQLKPGKLKVRGDGSRGYFKESKKINYDGPVMAFQVAPELLVELLKRHNECEITPETLKVDNGKFTYVTSLEVAGDEDAEDQSDRESGEGDD